MIPIVQTGTLEQWNKATLTPLPGGKGHSKTSDPPGPGENRRLGAKLL